MNVKEFISKIRAGNKYQYVYHFTDKSNISSMKFFGSVLSKEQQIKKRVCANKPGGDSNSQLSDKLCGISDYVSLCLTSNHPMAYRCRKDGRHPDQVYICFDPDILLTQGTMACLGLANTNGANIMPLERAIPFMDLEALSGNMQWSVETQTRVAAVEKYEILVPTAVSLKFAKKLIVPR